ncbi:MAG: transcriptional repressor LexA [Planctomycetota bacterium]
MGRTPKGQTREQVLAFVRDRLLAGAPPTVREVQHAFGFRSTGTAREHIDALVEQGKLTKPGNGKHRAVRLPGPKLPRSILVPLLVPLLGRVQAGALTEAIEEADDHVVVETRRSAGERPAGELFALRVRGDSMAPEMLEGDLLIVRRQPRAEHGDIVIAMVDGEATVKRLRLVRGRVELHASNPRFRPIVPEGELTLLGKVIELRRAIGKSASLGSGPRRSTR